MSRADIILKIEKAKHMGRHILKISFSDDTDKIIDFKPFLEESRNPEIRKYLSIKCFKKFKIRNGDLMWGDFDLIFPLMDLYANKISEIRDAKKYLRHSA